jgi:tetratricopeptide (TPR) repeat protein
MTADQPLDQGSLDDLWDFDDPEQSEQRFAAARLGAMTGTQEAELATQQARALGLQGRFDEAAALLDAVSSTAPVVEVRVLLERGRLHNSAGRPADAVPLFRMAAERATDAGLTFLAIDALHMVAIADPASSETVTRQALELVATTEDRRTRRWGVSLHNNLGWALHDEGRYGDALVEFEAAHRASQDVGTAQQEFVARWAIARCLRSLGRYAEALAMQERLAEEDPSDGYVTEEIEALRAALTPPS